MTYVVQRGDTMYEIAKKFGVPLAALIAANSQVKDPDLIYPGQVLNIPAVQGSPTPGPPSGWCTLCLTPLHPKLEPGSVLVNPGIPHVMVALMDMPDPAGWADCEVYTVWIMEEGWTMGGAGHVAAWFDLYPAVKKGFWINHTHPAALCMREHLCVTVENMGHSARPGSTMLFYGHLAQCCRIDP